MSIPLPRFRRTALVAALGAFAITFLAMAGLHSRSALHDTDSYYHLAIARAFAEEGVIEDLRWTRLNAMHEGFGDKEVLFHLLLAPLLKVMEPLPAGRLALALLSASLAAMIAFLASRVLGLWAMALPLWLFYASTELTWRAVRLRPELLAVTLLLLALWALASKRPRTLGLVTLAFTLGYTAFHALVGLIGLCTFWLGWRRHGMAIRQWSWQPWFYSCLGACLGLLLHPHFPKNLEIWVLQSFDFFLRKGDLNVGTEIRANFTDVTLMVNLGWICGLLVLWRSFTPATENYDEFDGRLALEGRLADVFAVASLVFGGLYLLMSRFSIYFIPLATLWLLFELARRGQRPSQVLRLPGHGALPIAVAVALCLLISAPEAWRQWHNYRHRTSLGPDETRLADRRAFSAAMPEGARVAARWGSTALYMLTAPQGRYLNVLDPVFMASPYPGQYRVLQSIFEGAEPDVPVAARIGLDSEHLAFSPGTEDPRLLQRMLADPRISIAHQGSHSLFSWLPGRNPFLLDWYLVPPDELLPIHPSVTIEDWQPYPHPKSEDHRALEAYVDLRWSAGPECVALSRELNVEQAQRIDLEWAPYGPSRLWLNENLVVATLAEHQAILGQGLRLTLDLEPGRQLLTALTCAVGKADERQRGFYLLERQRWSKPEP